MTVKCVVLDFDGTFTGPGDVKDPGMGTIDISLLSRAQAAAAVIAPMAARTFFGLQAATTLAGRVLLDLETDTSML